MTETKNPWPFKPGDVVRDSGEEGDDAAWLDAAPVGTVVRDRDTSEWKRLHGAWTWSGMRRTSESLARVYGPLTVVSVPEPKQPAPPTPAETTGAVERAAHVRVTDAVVAAFEKEGVTYHYSPYTFERKNFGQPPRFIADLIGQAAVAAALDVDEIDLSYRRHIAIGYRGKGVKCACGHRTTSYREHGRHQAEALVAAILGSDQ